MNDRHTNTIIGLIAGLTVGLAIGVALAPRPGKDTRKKLATRLKWMTWSPEERYKYLWHRTCEAEA